MLKNESILSAPYHDQLFYSTLAFDQPLYLVIAKTPLEYSLFGVNRPRNLFPVDDPEQVPVNTYLLISNQRLTDLPGFKLINSDDLYSIYLRNN